MEQLQLPIPRGGLCRFSVLAVLHREQGWTVEIWHQHYGSPTNCPSRWNYTELSLNELMQVLDDALAPGNGPYHDREGQCVPGAPPRQ